MFRTVNEIFIIFLDGVWRTDGCEIIQKNGSEITVHAHRLAHFALLQEVSFVYRLAAFTMEPAIYAGSGLCIMAMLAVISTMMGCFS